VIGEVIGGGTFTVEVAPRGQVPEPTGPITLIGNGGLLTADAFTARPTAPAMAVADRGSSYPRTRR
jgi:hypothetical protein